MQADAGPPSKPPQATQIAIAVVERQGQFLIGRRPEGVPLAGYWEFPGGKVQPAETPQQAAARECREETGIDVLVGTPYPERIQDYSHGTVRLLFFACQPQEPCGPPATPFRWVPRHELGAYRFPAGNQTLLQLLLDGDP
jgi:8-oxo-dGTP diphosphatase